MSSESLQVELSQHSYTIRTGRLLRTVIREEVDKLLKAGKPVVRVTDASVEVAQSEWIGQAFGGIPVCVVPSGEGSKCFEQLEAICDFLAAHKVDRSGVIFAVGGGVVGDLAGFAAGVYLRGIPVYQVPTTLLAMVDSSVGGKTGINLNAGKNLVGVFHQPQAVYADVAVLETLPAREFSAGMAEVIKHGLLADAELFGQLESLGRLNPLHADLPGIIHRNCRIKAGVVQADEKETAASGGRALLNLGHTFGHAVEAVAGYGVYLHGEAIGLGLVLAADLSQQLGYISAEDAGRVRNMVLRYDLPVVLRQPLPLDRLMAAMERDKKVRQGKLRFVALKRIGEAITVEGVDRGLVLDLWRSVGAE